MSTQPTSPSTEDVLRRIRGEYAEMPGLRVTLVQGQRLWGLDAALCRQALDSLVRDGFLRLTDAGQYVRVSDGPAESSPLRMAKAGVPETVGAPFYRRSAS